MKLTIFIDEYDIAAPIILNLGISITDNIRLDSNDRPDDITNIFVLRMLEIPGDNTTDPINNAVTNIIIIKGIYATSYTEPAKKYSRGFDRAAIPSAAGIYINDTIFNNILMLALNAILLSREKNDDSFGINKFDMGITSTVAALAMINAKL